MVFVLQYGFLFAFKYMVQIWKPLLKKLLKYSIYKTLEQILIPTWLEEPWIVQISRQVGQNIFFPM